MVKLRKVFDILRKSNLKINKEKSVWATKSTIFLGHQISVDGISVGNRNLRAIQELPVPRNLRSLKRYIGMTSFYKSFVPNFALIATPLYQLTKKNVPYKWEQKHDDAFNTLKKK